MVLRFYFTKVINIIAGQLLIMMMIVWSCNAQTIGQRIKSNESLRNLIYDSRTNIDLNYMQRDIDHYVVLLSPTIKKSNISKDFDIVKVIDDRLMIVRSKPSSLVRAGNLFSEVLSVNHLWKASFDLSHVDKAATGIFIVKVSNVALAVEKISAVPAVRIQKIKGDLIYIEGNYRDILCNVIVLDEVLYIGEESTQAVEESRVLDLNINPNTINRIHHEFPALNGANMTLSIKELKYNVNDIDLVQRDVPSNLSAQEVSNHATDMATIAAGAGNSHITGKGVAWAASITSSDFTDLLPDENSDYQNLDVQVQNHSYGSVIENFYGALAEGYDKSANENEHLLHVFSAGNQGTETSASGPYQGISGYANITGNYKMSKNTLTVGSVDTVGRHAPFSSRGPAYDGRVKPELVAYSTAGSSNSAALVSGVSVLLQQAYKQKFGEHAPSALLKAILVNSAVDVDKPGPDYTTGFGNLDGYRSLQGLNAGNFFEGSVTDGGSESFVLNVPANTKNLKITLAWNDPAASANAGVALVNDLDLSVEDGSNASHLPFVLNFTANKSKLELPASRGTDHRNNIEQVLIEEPAAGTYNIIVDGFDITLGPQVFYVAYQLDTIGKFEWSFPTGSDNIPYDGETVSYFHWKSTLPATSGRLEYTTNGGSEWKLIEDGIDLSKRYYRWNAPPETAQAHARMIADGEIYETDAFMISRPVTLKVGFNCPDSVMLQWDRVGEAKAYKLYSLTGAFIQPVLTLADTAVVLTKTEQSSPWYAVEPVLENDATVIRSLTYNYELQSSGCFLSAFFALRMEDGIKLTSMLTTTYGIDEIIFERLENGVFQVIGSALPDGNVIDFTDSEPNQGINTYRARISLINDQEIISETAQEFYLTKIPLIVFPNPVLQSETLNVYFKTFRDQTVLFYLYQPDGKRLKTIQFDSETETISVSDLAPGMYYYSFVTEEGRVNGKLVVR